MNAKSNIIRAVFPLQMTELERLKQYRQILQRCNLPLEPKKLEATLIPFKSYFTKYTSLEDIINAFLNSVKLNRSKNTYINYQRHLMSFLESNIPFSEDGINEFICLELKKGNTHSTINTKLSTFRSFSEWGHVRGYLPTNFMSLIDNLPEDEKVLDKIELDIAELFREIEQSYKQDWKVIRTKAIFLVFTLIGCRVSELINIKVDDLNMAECKIKLKKTKGGKERICYFSEYYAPYLKSYLKCRNEMQIESPYLFVNYKKEQLTRQGVYGIITKHTQQVGEKLGCHKLRHWCATTMLLAKNIPLVTVKDILGHKSVATTDRYTHPGEEDKRKAAQSMDGLL